MRDEHVTISKKAVIKEAYALEKELTEVRARINRHALLLDYLRASGREDLIPPTANRKWAV